MGFEVLSSPKQAGILQGSGTGTAGNEGRLLSTACCPVWGSLPALTALGGEFILFTDLNIRPDLLCFPLCAPAESPAQRALFGITALKGTPGIPHVPSSPACTGCLGQGRDTPAHPEPKAGAGVPALLSCGLSNALKEMHRNPCSLPGTMGNAR